MKNPTVHCILGVKWRHDLDGWSAGHNGRTGSVYLMDDPEESRLWWWVVEPNHQEGFAKRYYEARYDATLALNA